MAQVSYSTEDSFYLQNFNSLPSTGSTFTWTNNATLAGWYAECSAAAGFQPASISYGNSTTGDLYDFGSTSSSDRALGSIGSSTVGDFYWGVALTNTTGYTLTSFTMAYTGEEWRNSAAAQQAVTVQYSLGATALRTGTYTNISQLNFLSPVYGGTAGAINGNATASRQVLSGYTVGNIQWLNGQTLWLRWSDPDHTGFDHGLAIDDVSFTAHRDNPSYDPPTGYYDSAANLTGQALFDALHNIIKGQTIIPLDAATGVSTVTALSALDVDPTDNSKVKLIYGTQTVAASGYGTAWQREYLWPQSRGIGTTGADTSDLFNLRPIAPAVATARGTKYFDVSDWGDSQFVSPATVDTGATSGKDSDSWEPPADQRGDIARAIFYMDLRYDGNLATDPNTTDLVLENIIANSSDMSVLKTLLVWNALDPVNDDERRRNDSIYRNYQHNRNPFVDHPEYAMAIYGQGAGAPIDHDVDGMEDAWERVAHLNPNKQLDASEDTDGDGFTNFEEYWMGSNPRDAASPVTSVVDGSYTGSLEVGSHTAPYKTIQAAINAAPANELRAIIVAPGSYHERPYVSASQQLHIFSTQGAAKTFIEGDLIDSSAVRFYNFKRASFVGFTVRNAQTDWRGAGLRIVSTGGDILVSENIFQNNVSTYSYDSSGGGAIFIEAGGGSLFTNNLIINNQSQRGGGVMFSMGNVGFYNNTVVGNRATTALMGGGLSAMTGVTPDVRNNIIWGNTASTASNQINTLTLSNNLLQDGGANNITADPHFISPFLKDYHIRVDSPARGMSVNLALPPADVDGEVRPRTEGEPKDMGADEFVDTDGDGMPDSWELRYGLNPNDPADATGDLDSDQLTNRHEYDLGTDPTDSDTDDDGMPDGWEVDNDLNPLFDDSAADYDNDSLSNLAEYQHGTEANNQDTDGDGMWDGWEVQNQFNPLWNGDASLDADDDSVSNLREFQLGTNPHEDSGTDVGTTEGSASVDLSGSLNYSIPVWVTPGTAGMQPKLSLNYSNKLGNGPMGKGWSVGGLSSITRAPATRMLDGFIDGVDFNPDDRFLLDGSRLILISGTYGAAGSEYRTEMETMQKITFDGTSFTVQSKSGLTMTYGGTADSRLVVPNKGVLRWCCDKISDGNANAILFTYLNNADTTEQLPDSIDYTQTRGTSPEPYAHVKFVYETRPDHDRSKSYLVGKALYQNRRLIAVENYFGNERVRQYQIKYVTSSATQYSLVSQIKEFGLNNSCFKATTFKYQETSTELSEDNWGLHANDYTPGQTWLPGDFNNDGASDLVKIYKSDDHAKIRLYFSVPAQQKFSDGDTWVDDAGSFDETDKWIEGDFNGDGVIDLARVGNFSGHGKIKVFRNIDGTGFADSHDYYDQDSEFKTYARWFTGDFNADGLIDLCSVSGTEDDGASGNAKITIFKNNGDGTFSSHVWSNDGSFKNEDGWFVADCTGDGLPDLCRVFQNDGDASMDVYKNIYRNGNDGSFQKNRWMDSDKDWDDWVWKVGDFNGDGLADLVTGAKNDEGYNLRVYLSTGEDFSDGNDWVDGTEFFSANDLHVGDFNGDGRSDLMVLKATEDDGDWEIKRTVFLSRGNDFVNDYSESDDVSDYEVMTKAWLPGDFNGDGKEDLGKLGSSSNTSSSDAKVTIYSGAPGANDVMTETVNGLGVLTTAQYTTLLDTSVYTKTIDTASEGIPETDSIPFLAPMTVVKQISGDNGMGGMNTVQYQYQALRASRSRGSLGFRVVRAIDLTTGLTATSFMRQLYPYVGMAETALTSRTSDGLLLNQTDTEMDDITSLHLGVHFPFASQVIQSSYELDGSLTKWVKTNTSYTFANGAAEPYCNPVKITVEDNGGFKTTTENVYDHDVAKWHIGRVVSSTVTSHAPGKPDSVKHAGFDYSSSNGQLSSETVEPSTGTSVLELQTDYGFDVFGNTNFTRLTGSKDLIGTEQVRLSHANFDPTNGRLLLSSENALGHQDAKEYYANLGLIKKITDPNGLVATWTYDDFGRAKTSTSPDHIDSVTQCLRPDGESPSYTAFMVQQQTADLPISRVYLDKQKRELRSRQIDALGRVVYVDSLYDALGRLRYKSRPYFQTGTPIWSETRYDILNRPTMTFTPADDGSNAVISYAYQGLQTTVTDPLSHLTTSLHDTQGRVIQVTNHLNQNLYYVYDAAGNMTSITDEAGNVTSLEYDLRGRKTQMIDPDTGKWTYSYNAFGELVQQQDWTRNIGGAYVVAHTEETDYDLLGRQIEHREEEATDRWTYDDAVRGTSDVWLGKLSKTTRTLTGQTVPDTSDEVTYDGFGRVQTDSRVIDGETFASATTYDSLGRPETMLYPKTGFRIRNVYNANGALSEVRRDDGPVETYWKAENYDINGAPTSYLLGNGVRTQRSYYQNTGRLHTIRSGLGGGSEVQNLSYEFDKVGNLQKRQDLTQSNTEEFSYDELYRLKNSILNGTVNVSTTYDNLGNIQSKTGVGTYIYDPLKPHAVTQIGSSVKTYDDNGNLLTGSNRTISWTSFDMPDTISRGDASSSFRYDSGHQRILQISTKAGLTTKTIYAGAYERVWDGATYKHRHYISTPAGMEAIFVTTIPVVAPGGTPSRTDESFYQHHDHLGSLDAVTNGTTGAVLERDSFDAWGKRRDAAWTPGAGAAGSFFNRGFTGHEELDDLGLVHMNGRIYDPEIGRFLSADPNVQFSGNLQSYNRYSYVQNNPLSFTDPSGYLLNWIFPQLAGQIGSWLTNTFGSSAISVVSSVVGAVVGYWGGPIAGGAVTSGTAALLSGASNKDALIAAGEGAAIGAATQGVGSYANKIQDTYGTFASVSFQVVAHAAIGGAYDELLGGSFEQGALTGGISALSGPLINGNGHNYAGIMADSGLEGVAVRTALAATVGGTTSVIGGGKFANGAETAAFLQLFNSERDRLNSVRIMALKNIRTYIAQVAGGATGSMRWFETAEDIANNRHHCNYGVADVIEWATGHRPQVIGYVKGVFPIERDPTAHEWATEDIDGWSPPEPLSQARDGDVIAQAHGPWGHVGIVYSANSRVSWSVASNAILSPGHPVPGMAILGSWGFRSPGNNDEGPRDGPPVVRTYLGY